MPTHLALWRIARSKRPILVGPWTSEMGFEVLYWLPFLQYFAHRYGVDPQRIIPVTRGGAGVWYGTPRSIELYDYVPAKDLRLNSLAGATTSGSINQWRETGWERRLVALLAEREGLRRYHVLHPSLMFCALRPWWQDQSLGLARLMDWLRYTPPVTPLVPLGLTLPELFVAVRWYARPTWPMREDLLEWTQAVIQGIAKTRPVVILRSSVYHDDHADFPAPTGPNITVLDAEPWRENLAVQSAILKRATAFVGTWGGLAQLAVRLGIPTVAMYESFKGASVAHKMLTEWLALQQGTSLFVGRPHDAEAVRSVMPQGIALPDLPRGSSS